MPPLPPATRVLKIRFRGTIQSAIFNNILHSQYSGVAPVAADLAAYAIAVGAAWTAHLAPLASNAVAVSGIDVADLTSPTSASVEQTVALVGTRGPTQFTAQVAMVGSWGIQLRYRGGHPRTYFAFGVTADTATTTQWTQAFITEASNALAAFRTAMNQLLVGSATTQMVAVSYRSGKVLRPAPLVLPVTSVVVHPRVDTLRRRLGKERV